MPRSRSSKGSGTLFFDLERASNRLKKEEGKVAEKLLRKRVVEKSGRKCYCGGHIVKIKYWELSPVHFSGVYGPGSSRGPRIPVEMFTPLHCENCGVQYFKLPKMAK
ncbi:MAG: hypothetical protein HYT65_03860 [Candidatus Yanofskybacteria bacterium]|nr:hypothetical protein [Candidatus Yanofskybacteria bacterium]